MLFKSEIDILGDGVEIMIERDIERAAEFLARSSQITAFTGAGISSESGVPTFRGKDGLWRQYRAETLATPEAFERDPALVWQWYDWRRGLIATVSPNPGHEVLADWGKRLPRFTIITQNIDGLHEKAGSSNIVELHGNIWKLRCTREGTVTGATETPLPRIPPVCPQCQALLRPHVVWFGESLDPAVLSEAFRLSSGSEVMLVIGTSALVYPAASLPTVASEAGAKIIEINPDPTPLSSSADISLRGKSGEILPLLSDRLRDILSAGSVSPARTKSGGKDEQP